KSAPESAMSKSLTVYECPECGHVEGEEFWDARDREEKGLPACPNGYLHGQIDMECEFYVPQAELDRLRAELVETLEFYASKRHIRPDEDHPGFEECENGELARAALKSYREA